MIALYAFGTLFVLAGVVAAVRRQLTKRRRNQLIHLNFRGK
ncbi:MAG: hypothetical protein ACE5H2_07635 [Terriglobia bacterium]